MENRFFHSYFLGAFGLPWAIIFVRRVRSLLLSLPASVRFVSLAVAPVRYVPPFASPAIAVDAVGGTCSRPRPAQLPSAPVRCVLRYAPPAPAVWVVVPLFKNTTSKTKHDHAR